jgi:transcriptional/translational regulatory protein YebC/TACO1
VLCAPEAFDGVKKALVAKGLSPGKADVAWHAATTIAVQGGQAEALTALIHALEELDDVQHVHTNAAWARAA